MRCDSGSHVLQNESEAADNAADEDCEPVALSEVEHGRGGTGLVRGVGRRGASPAVNGNRCGGSLGRSLAGLRLLRRDGGVALGRVLGTTGVVCTTAVGAGAIAAAVLDALGAPFSADVIGDGLGVLGDVRSDTVVADAGVYEGLRVAFVAEGRHGLYAFELGADERACGCLMQTPCVPVHDGDGLGVNGVLLLCSGKASSSEEGEGDRGAHIDVLGVRYGGMNVGMRARDVSY